MATVHIWMIWRIETGLKIFLKCKLKLWKSVIHTRRIAPTRDNGEGTLHSAMFYASLFPVKESSCVHDTLTIEGSYQTKEKTIYAEHFGHSWPILRSRGIPTDVSPIPLMQRRGIIFSSCTTPEVFQFLGSEPTQIPVVDWLSGSSRLPLPLHSLQPSSSTRLHMESGCLGFPKGTSVHWET